MTYGELQDTVEEIREALRRVNPPGGRVALLMGNNWKHIAALLAVDAEELTAVPLDIKWSWSQVEERLALTSTRTLVQDDPGGLVVVQQPEQASFNAALQPDEALVINGQLVNTLAPTGGTSGTAKAVALSRRAVISRFVTQSVEFGFSRETTFLCTAPLFHGGGRSFVLSQLYFGGTVILHAAFEPAAFVRSLGSSDIAFVVPTMLQRLPRGTKASHLRCLIVSGAKVDDWTAAIASEISENAVDYYASVDTGPIGVRRISGGRRSEIAFAVRVRNMPINATDESPIVLDHVEIEGPCVADAELRNGRLDVFPVDSVGHPTVRMFDRVEFTSCGALKPLGRSDDLIVTGGVNVDPAAVEEALQKEFRADVEIAVIGVPDREWGQRVVAFVVGQGELDEERILRSVRKRLSGPETPKELRPIPWLPLTSVGKLDKQALVKIYEEDERDGN